MLTTYRYSIELRYKYNNDIIVMDSKSIRSAIIDYDYDDRNMPMVFVTLSIQKDVLNDMILNSKDKTVILYISKFLNNKDGFKISEKYIHDEFIYFLPNNLVYDKEIDDNKDNYKEITLGLMNLTLINNNKRLINDVVKSTSLMDIIINHTSHMNMIIKPIRSLMINSFIIPPLTTVTNLIKYLDQYFNLYQSPYRLFYDFDRTYLLDSSKNYVASKDDDLSSVMINISENTDYQSKEQGIDINKQLKTYIMPLNVKDTNIYEDKVTNISYNTIVGIGSTGENKSVELGFDSNVTKNKVSIERLNTNNLDRLNIIKSNIHNTSKYINISKTEIDTSVLTMNKSYTIKNISKLSENDGEYILSRKREVYTVDDQNFILSTLLNFRKILI
jgi:hypothetical protein